MTTRKLDLKRETLSALVTGDLQAVVGASSPSCMGSCYYDTGCYGESIKPTCQHTLCEVCTT